MFIDEEEHCMFYPSNGGGGEVLAMNGTPTIEVLMLISKAAANNIISYRYYKYKII